MPPVGVSVITLLAPTFCSILGFRRRWRSLAAVIQLLLDRYVFHRSKRLVALPTRTTARCATGQDLTMCANNSAKDARSNVAPIGSKTRLKRSLSSRHADKSRLKEEIP
jgi:hypothetical protein